MLEASRVIDKTANEDTPVIVLDRIGLLALLFVVTCAFTASLSSELASSSSASSSTPQIPYAVGIENVGVNISGVPPEQHVAYAVTWIMLAGFSFLNTVLQLRKR